MREKMSLSILLVDDSDVNLKIASRMLRKIGYGADTARNGAEAIYAMEHHYYDIVLMDIEMPVMDGIEATKIIRQKWHNSPRIIVITALIDCQDACFEAGADGYLTKPIDIGDLKDSIDNSMPIPSFNEFTPRELDEIAVV
jgi:CheY-like chemotaxis protein